MSASKFLEDKWRKGFRFLDINKDGILTKEDFEALAEHISKKTRATEEEKGVTRDQWVKWIGILQPHTSKALTEDNFCDAVYQLNKDLEYHQRQNVGTYSTLFDNLDLNKDGAVLYDELKLYYEGHGVKDEEFVTRVFQQLDINKDGKITRDEFIKAGVNFWTSSDENDGYSFMYDLPGV